MDIAHKEFLEKQSKEELINRILSEEDYNEKLKKLTEIQTIKLNEKEFLIEKLLKVIKYQNGLNDKE